MAEPHGVHRTRVLQELAQAVGADGGASLYLPDGDGALLLSASAEAPARRPRWPRISRGELEGRSLVVSMPDQSGGMLVLERRSNADFTREDHALVNLYARQLAEQGIATGGSRHSVWTRQLETIQRIAAQMTRLGSTQDVAVAICRELRRVIDYDEAFVLLTTDHGDLTQVAAERPAQGPCVTPPTERGPLAGVIERALQGGVPVLVADLADTSAGCPPATVMVVPLRSEGSVTGAICLVKHATQALDEDDVRLLQILADQAAVAFENAKLLVRKQELVRELNALLDVSNAANQGRDEVGLARVLAAKLRDASRMDACRIWRLGDGTTLLRSLAADQMAAPERADLAGLPAQRQAMLDGAPTVHQLPPASARSAEGPAGRSLAEPQPSMAAAPEAGFASVTLLPLVVGGRSIGLIELFTRDPGRHIGRGEMRAYQTMAGSVASGLENARLLTQLRVAADVDLLTGVNNHRYLQDRLQQETARSARSGAPLGVLMLDLDDFKPINDRFGHIEGDEVLRSVAMRIRAIVRTHDVVARYGGDEFVVVMPDTPRAQAQAVAKRVVAGIRAARHELSSGEMVSVGASAGLAVYPDDGHTAAALLQAADASMYRIKRASRVARSSGEQAITPPARQEAEPVASQTADFSPGMVPAPTG